MAWIKNIVYTSTLYTIYTMFLLQAIVILQSQAAYVISYTFVAILPC